MMLDLTPREMVLLKRLLFWAAGSSMFPKSRRHPYVTTAQYFLDKCKKVDDGPY